MDENLQKRKEFKKLLKNFGIEASQKIYQPYEEVIYPIETKFDDILSLYCSLNTSCRNKISFLYQEFEKFEDDQRIVYLASKLNLNTEGRIGKIDWKINYKLDPRSLTIEQTTEILFYFIKSVDHHLSIFKNLKETELFKPKQNDIIVGTPWDGSLIVPMHHPENARRRSVLNKKFGFGEVDQYNYQYTMFDENLNLQPI